jgi:uncharacterized membrane protein YfhO
MTYYAKSKTDNNYIIFISTISYLFCSWFLAYYFFLTWLDILVLLPLYQKGLEDLLDKKKVNMYILSLTLITICNIYLAFSIYIYTIIYFVIYELIYKKSSFKEKLLKFDIITLATIASFLINSFFLYLTFDSIIKAGLKFGNDVVTQYNIEFNFFTMAFFYGNISIIAQITGDTFPNIAMNSFVLMSFIYFFFNKKVSKKNRLFALIGLIILISTVFIDKVDFVLNFFHKIRGFTFRYSYIFSFLAIKLFIENMKNIDKDNIKKLLWSLIIIAPLLIISLKRMEFIYIVINISFLLCFTVAILLYQDNRLHKTLICALIVIETLCVTTLRLPDYVTKDNDLKRIKEHSDNKTQVIIKKENIDYSLYNKENVTYRKNYAKEVMKTKPNHILYEELFRGTKNEMLFENLYYNAKVTYIGSSMLYKNVTSLTGSIGCSSLLGSFTECVNEHKIANLLFNVKLDNEPYLEKIFAVKKDLKKVSGLEFKSAIDNHEDIIYNMSGIKDVYDKKTIKPVKEDEDNYYYEVNEGYYIIEYLDEDQEIATIPQDYQEFSSSKKDGLKEINIYVINKDKIKAAYDYLSKNQIKYTYYNDNHLEGTINVDEGQIIYTSIPYDESWKIKVDGKEVKPIMLLDALIGIEVEPGEHTITMEYKDNYLIPALMSLTGIIGFIIFNIKRKN